MITVVQRVAEARVLVDEAVVGAIGRGALLLVGVERGDSRAEAEATARKVAALRFFPGATPMDRTLRDVDGGCLVISQFTLAGRLRKGNRPSFTDAEDPQVAAALYEHVAEQLRGLGLTVATGSFGARMSVVLTNDGPVTFVVCAREGRIQDLSRGS